MAMQGAVDQNEIELPTLNLNKWTPDANSAILHGAARAAYIEADVTEKDIKVSLEARLAEHLFLALALPDDLEERRRELIENYCTDRLDVVRRKWPKDRVVRRALKAAYAARNVPAESIKAHERIIAAEGRIGRARKGVLAVHGDRLKECFGTRDLWQAMEAERANWHIWNH